MLPPRWTALTVGRNRKVTILGTCGRKNVWYRLTNCGSLARSGVVDDVTDQEVTDTKTVDGQALWKRKCTPTTVVLKDLQKLLKDVQSLKSQLSLIATHAKGLVDLIQWFERREVRVHQTYNKAAELINTYRAMAQEVHSTHTAINKLCVKTSCPLFSSPATLRHILTGCKVALSQGRLTWRHDQVLLCLALALEDKCNMTNKLPPVPSKHYTQKTTFLRPGEQPPRNVVKTNPRLGQLEAARDWKILADVGQWLILPPRLPPLTFDQILSCGLDQHALFTW
ncbi:UNVERIFIED_CONTAM: hypothetical protein FKN15_047779 [Acipenser sinensis]